MDFSHYTDEPVELAVALKTQDLRNGEEEANVVPGRVTDRHARIRTSFGQTCTVVSQVIQNVFIYMNYVFMIWEKMAH